MKRNFCKIGMISGVVAVVMGIIIFIVVMVLNSGCKQTFIREGTKFGADFYTYVYDKIEDIFSSTVGTNNNISYLTTVVGIGLTFILISFGLFQISFFGWQLNLSEERKSNQSSALNQLDNIAEKLDKLNASLKSQKSSPPSSSEHNSESVIG